jgi:aminoglycoside/choline kinase family phosphotransferase
MNAVRDSQVNWKDEDDNAFSAVVPAFMVKREQALRDFAVGTLGGSAENCRWEAVTGDASSRRYFRLIAGDRSWICADSPPETEKNEAFLAVQRLLAGAGLPVPAVVAVDPTQGFFLLEDFGDRHLLQTLDTRHPPSGYGGALELLVRLQAVESAALPRYSRAVLEEEFSRFYLWFCQGWLALPECASQADLVKSFGELLIDAADEQPEVFVFRDYHSRNLLLRSDGTLGLIDFQDAVSGPLCYDLASLLKDCYIRWPARQVRQWALDYRRRLLELGRPAGDSDGDFMRWFDWVGLHRHIKVLGNFTRLALRDNKSGYLRDIPLVLDYIEDVLEMYPEFTEFRRWFRQELGPLIARQDWRAGS